MWQQNKGVAKPNCEQQEIDGRGINWREFLLLCGVMYRQVLPGTLLLAGVMVLAIILLSLLAG